jgi:hypothetical protein
MIQTQKLGLRWTAGDVSARGFEALRLSLWGAWNLFGPEAAYLVAVNSLALADAQRKTGTVPGAVQWLQITAADIPDWLQPHLDPAMAEGVAWKLAPLRFFPNHYELALDNDCILWDLPDALRIWLDGRHADHVVFAEDATRALGQFSDLCGPEPRNSGIRGLPPDFDYGRALQAVLKKHPVLLSSELDEQGLQAAALEQAAPLLAVSLDDVTICSPFPPHRPALGRCGAHFVGTNAHSLPWSLAGRPATAHLDDHWRLHRPTLYTRVGLATPPPPAW